ncbi:MAG: carbohydrate ABC transporter permease [Chloroflexota bacterium]|nr:carbohydrate ABC transporter permease [Chloroflexota bacterium]
MSTPRSTVQASITAPAMPRPAGVSAAPARRGVEERTRSRTARGRLRLTPLGVAGWAALLLLVLFTAVPMAWMVSTSVKTEFAAIQQPPNWVPLNPTLDQYTRLLNPGNRTGQQFLGYLRNSLWVSSATTVMALLVAVPAAYAFARFRFPGKNALFFSVLIRNMFPAVVFLIPLFILMRIFNLVNNHWSLILTYLTFGLPLSIWLLKGFFENIPPELEQAARIDGATRFQAFRLIILPLATPGVVATAIYAFIQAWNEYVYARTFIIDDSLRTMPVGLEKFFTEYVSNWPGLMAASFIMSVPVVVLFLVLQRHFVRALTEGAVKH